MTNVFLCFLWVIRCCQIHREPQNLSQLTNCQIADFTNHQHRFWIHPGNSTWIQWILKMRVWDIYTFYTLSNMAILGLYMKISRVQSYDHSPSHVFSWLFDPGHLIAIRRPQVRMIYCEALSLYWRATFLQEVVATPWAAFFLFLLWIEDQLSPNSFRQDFLN